MVPQSIALRLQPVVRQEIGELSGTLWGLESRDGGEVRDFLRTGRNVPPGPRCFPPGGRHGEGWWQAPLNVELQRFSSTYGSRE